MISRFCLFSVEQKNRKFGSSQKSSFGQIIRKGEIKFFKRGRVIKEFKSSQHCVIYGQLYRKWLINYIDGILRRCTFYLIHRGRFIVSYSKT